MGQPATWKTEAIRFGEDLASGAVLEQLTSEPVTSTNIYCEQRYASADGTRIALARTPFGGPPELWVCDLRALRLGRVGTGKALSANPARNAVYYRDVSDGAARLMRLDLMDLSTRELLRFEDGRALKGGAISPDERWFVTGPFPIRDNVYALRKIDLAGGRTETLCEIEDMFNPHTQFDPAGGLRVVVQINRGGQPRLPTGPARIAGPLGTTLGTVEVTTGQYAPLPVGRPHTPPLSGHECWIGKSGRVLFSAGQYRVSPSAYVVLDQPPEPERDMPTAALYSVAPGDAAPRMVAEGLLFNHLAASDDGRFFVADDHATGRIYIGSIATGAYRGLCDTQTRQGTCQYSHAHAYMTPDNAWVIYNSIATGVAQVYAARVPAGFLDQVLTA